MDDEDEARDEQASRIDARRESESLRRWRETQHARRCRSQAWLLSRAAGGEKGRLTRAQLDSLPRPARCGWPLGHMTIRLHEGKAFLNGAEHCASPWACPLCTPIIRTRRARDLRRAVDQWQASAGHTLVFATLTITHTRTERLARLMDVISAAWSRMRGSHAWRGLAAQTGIRHHVRSMETTWSPASGWHAHLHALLFTDTPVDTKRLEKGIRDLWSQAVHAVDPQRRPISKRHGVLVERIDEDGTRVADYLAKSPDRKTDIASEMTRGDRKQGRRTGSLAPFELLDDDTGLDPEHARRLWLEYVDSTYRRRTITWSRRLRADTGLDAMEPADEAIIQDTVHGIPVIDLSTDSYRTLRNAPSLIGRVLQYVEDGQIPLAETVIGQAARMDGTRD